MLKCVLIYFYVHLFQLVYILCSKDKISNSVKNRKEEEQEQEEEKKSMSQSNNKIRPNISKVLQRNFSV